MKKILSFLLLLVATFILVSCDTPSDTDVSGTKLSTSEEMTVAFENLSTATQESVVGNTLGMEFMFDFTQQTDSTPAMNLAGEGSLFVTIAEELADFKVHAELSLDTNAEGFEVNGDAGFYILNENIYTTGIASYYITDTTLADVGFDGETYNELITSITSSTFPENNLTPIIDDAVFQEMLDLLIEHNLVSVYKDGEKYSFVLNITIEKLNTLALATGEESLDLEGITVFNLDMTIIVKDGFLQFFDVRGEIAGTIDTGFMEEPIISTIAAEFALTISNNATMPAFPKFN